MSRYLRAALGALAALGLAVVAVPAHQPAADAAVAGRSATSAIGYPTPAATGFHHLALMYDNPARTTGDVDTWVAQHRNGVPVQGRWMFDSFLMLDLTAPSGTATDIGATTAADWNALLDRWFGTTAGGGTIGHIDASLTRVAATRSTAGTPMGQPPTRRKIVVTIPWAADTQATFGTVDGRAADLRIPSERDRVTAWYLDKVKQRFAAASYRNVDLWGVYLMREDILPGDEAWVTHTATAAHQRAMKIAWIPYYRAPGWQQWRTFGLDVAIMQPTYAFMSPADGGQVDASRLVTTAEQASAAGLGVEVEARSAAGSAYEAAMFQQYLSEGTRLGYRDAASAYFVGWSTRPAMRDDSYSALADYLAGTTVRAGDTQPAWSWAGTSTRTASTTFAARDDLTAIRADLSVSATATATTWRGTVAVSELVQGVWKAAGTTYAGTPPVAGTRQEVVVPLAGQTTVTGLRVSFTPAAGAAPVAVDRMVLDAVWPTANGGAATGAPYTISSSAAPAGQYSDSAATVAGYGRGLLTDGQWSTSGWWNARPVGWWNSPPVRIQFDLGAVRPVDRVVLYTHDATDASVNWPLGSTMQLSTTCPVLTSALRGAVDNCGTTTLAGTAPAVTFTGGATGRSADGAITFAAPTATNARYATLIVQPTGWFLADEVRFFAGGVDVTGSVGYRLLTPPNPQGAGDYGDNGVRLTDGNVAPLMSGPAVTGWNPTAPVTVTVDLLRQSTVRKGTAWFVDNASWGVVVPRSVTVQTSTDGVNWTVLGSTTTVARTWYAASALTVTGTPRPARYVRTTVAADPTRSAAWFMLSEVEAGA